MTKTYETVEKIYYSIGEISAMIGVEPSCIRFWEKEFEQLRPKKKGRRGDRKFTEEDIKVVKRICRLLKHYEFTLSGTRKMLNRIMK